MNAVWTLLALASISTLVSAEQPFLVNFLTVFTKSEECSIDLLQGVFDMACIKTAISRLLGFGIILGSCILKVPQILKVVNAKSSEGISASSLYLETVAYTFLVIYNVLQQNDLTSYSECFSILIQDYILLWVVWKYAPTPISASKRLQIVLFYCTLAAGIFFAPVRVLWFPAHSLQVSIHWVYPTIILVMGLTSRIPQIIQIFRDGHTGQNSLIMWTLNWAGSGARVFTTFQLVNDLLLLAGNVTAFVNNSIILLQIIFYWKATNKALEKKGE